MERDSTQTALFTLLCAIGGWCALHNLTVLFYAITNVNGSQSHMQASLDQSGIVLFLFSVPCAAIGLIVFIARKMSSEYADHFVMRVLSWGAVTLVFSGILVWFAV